MDDKLFYGIPYRLIFRGMWMLSVLGVIAVAFVFVYVAKTKMPDTSELENPRFEESTIVYSSDGKEIDRYFSKNRQWVSYEDLSPHVIDALIATEDHRFFNHSGIDSRGTLRAIAFVGTRGGASTITQQLAKQFYTPTRSKNPIKRIWQKMKEWVIAVEFERRYTKNEIISMFLNKFDFIYGANGISAAANVYFGKNQKNLSVDEAALLIGMLKNPYLYNPKKFPERAIKRRSIVLKQMRKRSYISLEEYEIYKAIPLDMSDFNRAESYKGIAPYFMSELKKYVNELLRSKHIFKAGGDSYDLDSDGLKIYTTLDTRYQKHAEAAMNKHMKQLQRAFDKVWENNDPWTFEMETASLKTRKNQLNFLVESSNRYYKLRRKYLNEISKKIQVEIDGARLWNNDIKRLLLAEKDNEYLSGLLKKNSISKDQKRVYELILNSTLWTKLKNSWNKLTIAKEVEFNKRQKTRVFSYDGDREKYISPLDSIKYMSKFLQFGSMAMDPHTGYVKSWVGGIDYNNWKYDHITSNRQVGSTFKPFLYTAALMNSFSPCWKVKDIQYTIAKGDPDFELTQSWSPQNSHGEFSNEYYSLKDGLRKSLNSVSVWLVKELRSVEQIISIAENMGIGKDKIPPYPSIVLGTPSLSVYEMTTAYGTFANNGIKTEPVLIEKIEDRSGKTIYKGEIVLKRAIPENYNFVMTELLKYASSSVQWALESEFGGKTGTTNDHVDGWYMGISPNLVVGTWVGGEYPWVHFLDLSIGQGAVMARPFYLDFMGRLEMDPDINYDKSLRFFRPDDLGIELDCQKYELLEQNRLNEDEFDDPFGQ